MIKDVNHAHREENNNPPNIIKHMKRRFVNCSTKQKDLIAGSGVGKDN